MQKYFVYYNLHKHTWSLRNHKTKLVDDHSDYVTLIDCEFKVSQAGRSRVLTEKRKNVHAGILGTVSFTSKVTADYDADAITDFDFTEVTYNPYKYDSFVVKTSGKKVNHAEMVIMVNRRVFARGIS